MNGAPDGITPAVSDAVVLNGTKHRIRSIDTRQVAALALSGPSWKRSEIVDHIDVRRLVWDKRAAVWRWDVEAGGTW